jgi:hypothetical protein
VRVTVRLKPNAFRIFLTLLDHERLVDGTREPAVAVRGRLGWQPRPAAPVLTTRPPPGVPRTPAHNRLGSRTLPSSAANRGRRARVAFGCGCRLSPAHPRSNGPTPAGSRRPDAAGARSAREPASRAANREGEPSRRTKTVAKRDCAAVSGRRHKRWRWLGRYSSVRGSHDLVGPPRRRQGSKSKRRFSGSPIDGSRSDMAGREPLKVGAWRRISERYYF